MASETTSERAGQPPPTPPPPGIFCQAAASHLVLATEEQAQEWMARMRQEVVPWESFVMLKLLAPLEAADVMVAGWPQLPELLRGVERRLVERFRREMERRPA